MKAQLAPSLAPLARIRWSLGASAPWVWLLASAAVTLFAGLLVLALDQPLLVPLAAAFDPAGTGAGTFGHGLKLALGTIAWSTFALAGCLLAARLCFGRGLTVTAEGWMVMLAGGVIAASVQLALHEWARYRFGLYDPDLVGVTALLFGVVVVSSLAGAGALAAPRRAVLAPTLVALAAAAVAVVIVLSNLPGLSDGMPFESVLPALLIAAALLHCLLVALLATWSLARDLRWSRRRPLEGWRDR